MTYRYPKRYSDRRKKATAYALPIEIVEYIEKTAEKEDRSRSDVATRILQEYFEIKNIQFN